MQVCTLLQTDNHTSTPPRRMPFLPPNQQRQSTEGKFHSVSVVLMPSALWRCWLGGRKGIQPVKNWVVGCCCGYLSGVMCRLAHGSADATGTHCLCFSKIQIGFAFCYRLTWVVPDKGPLNGCVCSTPRMKLLCTGSTSLNSRSPSTSIFSKSRSFQQC